MLGSVAEERGEGFGVFAWTGEGGGEREEREMGLHSQREKEGFRE